MSTKNARSGFFSGPFFAFIMALVLVLVLWGPGLFSEARLYAAQYSNDMYAFYLDSGHVFFGQVRGVALGHVTLTNAYSFQQVSVGDTSTNNFLAQRDNPLTKPENWLVLERSRILFFEKVGPDASVLRMASIHP